MNKAERVREEIPRELLADWDRLHGSFVVESDPIDGDYWFKNPDADLPVDTRRKTE